MHIKGTSGTNYKFQPFYSDLPEGVPFPEGWDFEANPGIFLYTRSENPGTKIIGYALSVRIYTREEFHRIRYINSGRQADSVFFLPAYSKTEAEALAEDLEIQNLLRLYTCL
jgi:hypothetical protein